MIKRLIVVAFIAAGVLIAARMPASPRDLGQWEDADPRIKLWFEGLRQPDNPNVSCCGTADAYWTDKIEVEGDKVFAIITDTRPDEPLPPRVTE